MVKEWLSWVAGGERINSSSRRRRRRRRMIGEVKEATSTGCMCAVFQLFDLHHHFQFPLNQQRPHSYFLQEDDPITSKGVEAPRSSLELEEPPMKSASFPLKEKNLKIPAPIQIRRRTSCDSISESSTIDSPGTKTPNLVARLMGLDLLPECDSPVISSSSSSWSTSRFPTSKFPKPHLHSRTSRISFSDDDISIHGGGGGGGSLPETPRISLARRSDVDHHHRLSLQINKENVAQDFDISAFKKIATRRVQENDENRSPRHYAKQIVKQVRESFSRRVGLQDITNNAVKKKEQRRDENLLKKPVKALSRIIDEESVRKGTKVIANVKPPLKQEKDLKKCDGVGSSKSKKLAPRVSDSMRNKKEETFVRSTLRRNKVNLVDKKSKKTPLSNELPNINVPTLLPIKKDPSPPATKLPQEQVSDSHTSKRSTQLSCSSSHSYKQDTKFIVQENIQHDKQSQQPIITAGEYRQYVQRILKRIGIIDKPNSIIPLLKLRSPSRPLLDPSIFHFLELFHPSTDAGGVLTRRCNRKLIFQLVDELLAEIVKPHNCFITWDHSTNLSGPKLIDELCKKIQSFPAANCRVLEDIDRLIDTDLCMYRCAHFEEEGEGIVSEIERQILDSLLHETIADFGVITAGPDGCHVVIRHLLAEGGPRVRCLGFL